MFTSQQSTILESRFSKSAFQNERVLSHIFEQLMTGENASLKSIRNFFVSENYDGYSQKTQQFLISKGMGIADYTDLYNLTLNLLLHIIPDTRTRNFTQKLLYESFDSLVTTVRLCKELERVVRLKSIAKENENLKVNLANSNHDLTSSNTVLLEPIIELEPIKTDSEYFLADMFKMKHEALIAEMDEKLVSHTFVESIRILDIIYGINKQELTTRQNFLFASRISLSVYLIHNSIENQSLEINSLLENDIMEHSINSQQLMNNSEQYSINQEQFEQFWQFDIFMIIRIIGDSKLWRAQDETFSEKSTDDSLNLVLNCFVCIFSEVLTHYKINLSMHEKNEHQETPIVHTRGRQYESVEDYDKALLAKFELDYTYSNKMPEQKSHSNVYTNVTQHIIQKYLRFFYKIYKEICGGDEKNYKENLNKLVEADNKQTVIYSGDENCSGSNYTGSYVGSPAVGSLGDNLESGGYNDNDKSCDVVLRDFEKMFWKGFEQAKVELEF